MKPLLVFVSIEYTYGRVLLSGVLEAARSLPGVRVRLARSTAEMERIIESGESFDAAIGMIWTPEVAERLRQCCGRLVSFANMENGPADRHVTVDDRAVGEMAAKELGDLGLERVAVYQPERHLYACERSAGFRETWAKTKFSPVRVLCTLQAAARYLEASDEPSGIFACNDVYAHALIEYCEQKGMAVPDRISILGVDNDEVYVHLGKYLLSSIQLPFRAMGMEAVRLAFSQTFPGPSPRRFGPLGVVHRETTAAVGRYPPVLRNFLNQLRRCSPLPASVAQACALWKLPRRTLELACRSVAKETPGGFLREERKKRAARLKAAGLSAKEISYELGYAQVRSIRKLL